MQVTEYQKVIHCLNKEICEPLLKFSFVVENMPELNWEDGTQKMILRCEKHLLTPGKPSSAKKEVDMDSCISSDTDISQDSIKVTTRHQIGEIFGR